MNGPSKEDQLFQNLKDAGCDGRTVETFFKLRKEGRQKEVLRLLSLHRASLLDQLHVSQQRLDCLDYLIYTMKRERT
ncbi:MAG TPA: hypothetical protein H9669_06035 [Firmicutes bacterium]|mgnify:CR=1 FL=1|nr:hypothetical protein [Bacillota bacterium]